MKIHELMSRDVVTAESYATIKEALAIMDASTHSKLPVLNNGVLVGVIVKHDINSSVRRQGVVWETPVEWLMSKKLLVVHPDDDVVETAKILVEKKICGVPVIDNDKLVGIVTATDIINQFIKDNS